MLLLIAKIIGALSAYGKPGQIAFAMAMGLILALIPGGTVLWVILLIPMMLVRINQAAMMGTMAVFRLLAPLYDPFSERFGYFLLTRPALYEPMGRLLSVPGLSWLRLDDSLVAGGFALGIAGLPVYCLVFRLIVGLYRRFLAGKAKAVFRKIGAKVPWAKKFGMAISAARLAGVSA